MGLLFRIKVRLEMIDELLKNARVLQERHLPSWYCLLAGTDKRAIPSVQIFLLFPYLWGVLFKNLNAATLSSLGNPPNMQIKATITENHSFVNNSVTVHDITIVLVSVPMFWRIKIMIKPFQSRLRLYFLLNMHFETIITENHVFVHISINLLHILS